MIYTIGNDLSHRPSPRPTGVPAWDVELIYFDGYRNIGFSNPKMDFTDKLPPVIEFLGNLDVLEWSDFPYLPQSYPLMSKKMLDVLLSVQSFKYRVYPTLIYSYEIEELVRYTFDGTRTDYHVENPSLFTDKFVIMQLAETTNALDLEKTIIEGKTVRESGELYLSEYEVEHFEFTRNEKDLPPVFKVPEALPYFYTEAAVRALEANNIRGVEFRPIPQKAATVS
jgi:hypothetical protein